MRASHAFASMLVLTVAVSTGSAQTPRDPSVTALERALDRRLTVWRNGDRSIYVSHCRHARGGCRERTLAFARLIGDVSQEHQVDPFLLAAIAIRESGLDPTAAGAAGERGIVQLHPRGSGSSVRYVQSEAYRRSCARRPDACQREVLEAGAALLSRGIQRCGGVREGLGAYNRGVCGATRYATRVMTERQRLLRLAKTDAETVRDLD
ncbi:MAG: transglycosylase SLT domain-containing protein [Myxococcales bacterium]|nr:transglycosylase SLT domain-containing protein [Myxococcales bacterium]